MKIKSTFRHFLILAASGLLLAISSASAASGIWDTDADGDWTTVTNWSGDAAFASGIGFTATLGDFITADRTINLDTPITIGNITASDTSHDYTISGANNLTLDVSSGSPNINVTSSGRNLANSSVLAGADGISKTGLGTLTLSGSNTITGATSISGGGTLVLDYTTNDNRKLPNNSTLSLAAGTIVLKGGTATENFTSTTFNTGTNGTFFVRDTGTAKLNLNAFTVGTGSVVSFSHDSMATTDRLNVAGIMGAWFTVGNRWATNAGGVGGAGAADSNIVGYTGGTTFTPAAATSMDVNYDLAGSATLTGTRQVNTLRIESTGDDQVLNLGANNIQTSNLTGTNALAGTSGGLLYAGGANGNYTITGTTGRLQIENQNGQGQLINVYSGTLTVDAIVGSGSSPLVKSGEGTLVLKEDNAYGTSLRVYQGVVRLDHNNALETPSTVQNGAAIELSNGISIGAFASTITGTGISNGGALRSVATTTSSFAGAITLGTGGARINSDSTGTLTLTGGIVTAGNNITFGGAGNTTVSTTAISGSGGLVKDGAGTLTLSATNSFTGTATVNAGTLSVGNGTNSTALPDFGGLAVASPAVVDLNYSGSDAVLTLNLGGSPMVAGQYGHTNSGADNGGAGVGFYDSFFAPNTGIINNLAGDTSLIGVLFWDGGAADIGTNGNAISAGGTGTWNTTTLNWDSGLGAHVAWDNSGNDTAVLGGADGTVTLGEPITAGGITSSSTSTISGASALTLDVISGSPIIDVTANTLTISSDIAGNDGLQKTGAGTLLLTGNKSFSGGLTLSAGTLQVNDASSVFGTGTLTVGGGQIRANANGQTSTTTNNHVWNGNFQLSRGTTGSAAWNFQGDVTLGANVTVTHADNTVTTNLSGDISDGGNNRVLTLAGGSGFFILSGDNTHGGGTTLSAGTLRINSATAIGTGTFTISGASTIDNTSGNPITLSTDNVQAWNENFTFTGTNDLNLGTGAVTMSADRTITVTAGTLTVGGAIGGGSRKLTKSGNGTLVLGGASTYSNTTTVSAGTLSVTGSLGASAVSVNAGTLSGNGNFGGNVTIASGATHSIAVAATNGAQDTSAITGTLAMANSILNLTAASTPAAGEYVLATATVGITGTPTTINYNGITGLVSVDTVSTPKRLLLTVTGGGGAPEIAVEQPALTDIVNGGSQGFGTVTLGSMTSLAFTIRNSGTAALNLTGTPPDYVVVSGANAGDFLVTAQPSTPVAASPGVTTTTFTVQFAPLGVTGGARNAVLTIANDDSDEGTFTINVSGTAQTKYEAWAGGALFDADANGDGVDNGLAFLLGATGPNAAVPARTMSESGGNLIMTFSARNDASRGSAILNIQHSSDLGIGDSWVSVPVTDAGTAASGVTFSVTPGSPNNTVTATISNTEATAGKLFGRLKAEDTP